MIFVPQNLPESISADLKRFEPICLSLNSTRICSTSTIRVVRRTECGNKYFMHIHVTYRYNSSFIPLLLYCRLSVLTGVCAAYITVLVARTVLVPYA